MTHQQGFNISEMLELRGVFFLTQQRGQLVLIGHPIDQAGFARSFGRQRCVVDKRGDDIFRQTSAGADGGDGLLVEAIKQPGELLALFGSLTCLFTSLTLVPALMVRPNKER